MIQWSLVLTSNQMAILEALEDREFGKPHNRPTRGLSHWLVAARVLEREGLLDYQWHLRPGTQLQDTDKCGHFITERGKFILGMIREDMEKFIKTRDSAAGKKDGAKKKPQKVAA